MRTFFTKTLLVLTMGLTVFAVQDVQLAYAQGGNAGTSKPAADRGSAIDNSTNGGIAVAGGTDSSKGDSIIGVVKTFINYVLSFLGLIALVMLLVGGFKIVTAGGDEEAYQGGLKVLKNAAIGIAFIGVSWFLVSFIFYVFGLVTGG